MCIIQVMNCDVVAKEGLIPNLGSMNIGARVELVNTYSQRTG